MDTSPISPVHRELDPDHRLRISLALALLVGWILSAAWLADIVVRRLNALVRVVSVVASGPAPSVPASSAPAPSWTCPAVASSPAVPMATQAPRSAPAPSTTPTPTPGSRRPAPTAPRPPVNDLCRPLWRTPIGRDLRSVARGAGAINLVDAGCQGLTLSVGQGGR